MKLLSFGYRCSSISIIKEMGYKNESYPFDWIISDLNTIEDCLKNNFKYFLDKQYYIKKEVILEYNIDEKIKYELAKRPGPNYNNKLKEYIDINKYYNIDITATTFYNCKLGILHHDIINDYGYFIRCINRLYTILNSKECIIYIYINNIIDFTTYNNNKNSLLSIFNNFNKHILTYKNKNIYGIYFILIESNFKEDELIFKDINYEIYGIYCNNKIFDAGTPFINGENEKKRIKKIINKIINEKNN